MAVAAVANEERRLTVAEVINALIADGIVPREEAERLVADGVVTPALTAKRQRHAPSITAEGTEFLTAQAPVEETSEQTTGFNWDAPKWVDLNGTLAKAGKRVASVSLEVAQHGTKEQQAEAAKALDEARRKLHNILASE